LYDAKWQNPFHSAKKITRVLEGKHKPIYHPMNDTGDHVVVINSRHVALLGREWQFRVYFHHPGNISSTYMQYNWITISLMWIIFNFLKKAKL
jgi:large subunit ribosomal protein L13